MASKKRQVEYSFLFLAVTDFNVRVGAAISVEARTNKHADPNTKVYEHQTVIELHCTNIDPDEPLTDIYSFSIYGDSKPSRNLDATLEDFHEEDAEGFKKYRKRNGIDLPVYNLPKGLAVLEKIRGARSWTSALWLTRDVVSDMLTLLTSDRQVYAMAHLKNDDKLRWVVGLDLQTESPEGS